MLDAERDVLNRALEKYRLGHSEPILVEAKTCSNLHAADSAYRLVIEEIKGAEVITSYTPMGRSSSGAGSGKTGSLSDIQPAIRTDLARVEKTAPGIHSAKSGQYRAPKPVRFAAVQLGKKLRHSRYQAHFAGGASEYARP